MIKKIILHVILLAPALAISQTVSNSDYIKKQIEIIKKDSDHTYDEMKKFFSEGLVYKTTCYEKEPNAGLWGDDEEKVDHRFNKFRPVPKNYIHEFKLTQKKLGFDLQMTVSADFENSNQFSQDEEQVYSLNQQLKCVSSDSGCSHFYLETPLEQLSYDPEEEEMVELKRSWAYYIADKNLMYASYNIELSVLERNFIGAKTGTERHYEAYLCVMELVE